MLLNVTVEHFDGAEYVPPCPTSTSFFTEAWFTEFYGRDYYMTAFEDGKWRGMAETKGGGQFTFILVKDSMPLLTSNPDKGIVNANMLRLKQQLRSITGQ